MTRLFVALDLTPEQRKELVVLQNRAVQALPDLRLLNGDGLHLTLQFIGDVPAGRIEALSQVLCRTAAVLPPFTLACGGGGVFPTPGRARVVWTGLRLGELETSTLAAALSRGLEEQGISPDKKAFHPHVSLGRFRLSPPRRTMEDWLEAEKSFEGAAGLVREAVLYESELRREGAYYRVLSRAPLGQESGG